MPPPDPRQATVALPRNVRDVRSVRDVFPRVRPTLRHMKHCFLVFLFKIFARAYAKLPRKEIQKQLRSAPGGVISFGDFVPWLNAAYTAYVAYVAPATRRLPRE